MRRCLAAALVAVGVVLGAAFPPRSAQAPTPKQEASDLAHQLMSPFCPGKLLSDCTSPNAGVLREEMAKRIAAGESAEAVKADVVRRYGAAILGAPEAEGIGLLAWVLPALLGVASAAAIAWKIVHAARETRDRQVSVAAAGADAARLARLDDELRDLD